MRTQWHLADWTRTNERIARNLGVTRGAVQAKRKALGIPPVATERNFNREKIVLSLAKLEGRA